MYLPIYNVWLSNSSAIHWTASNSNSWFDAILSITLRKSFWSLLFNHSTPPLNLSSHQTNLTEKFSGRQPSMRGITTAGHTLLLPIEGLLCCATNRPLGPPLGSCAWVLRLLCSIICLANERKGKIRRLSSANNCIEERRRRRRYCA